MPSVNRVGHILYIIFEPRNRTVDDDDGRCKQTFSSSDIKLGIFKGNLINIHILIKEISKYCYVWSNVCVNYAD